MLGTRYVSFWYGTVVRVGGRVVVRGGVVVVRGGVVVVRGGVVVVVVVIVLVTVGRDVVGTCDGVVTGESELSRSNTRPATPTMANPPSTITSAPTSSPTPKPEPERLGSCGG